MASITISFPESGLSVAISVRNRLTGSLDFSGAMVNIPTIPDVGPTKSYRFDFTEEADTDYTYTATATGYEIEGTIYRDIVGSGGGATPEEIYIYFTTENREYAFKGVGGGGIIDTTKKHEEIIEKYEKIMKEELKKIIQNIPKTDISSVITAISNIPRIDLSDMILALTALRGQIKIFDTTIKNDYISERNRIESEYKNEIDKKTSLLQKNEYNAKEKEKIIIDLSSKILSLVENIEKLQEEKEEEMKIIEETYIDRIEEVKVEKEEEIVEKIIPLLS